MLTLTKNLKGEVIRMSKKSIIVGAGISGLSAGCYGRMNGYDTEVFEMHSLPGGVCTG